MMRDMRIMKVESAGYHQRDEAPRDIEYAEIGGGIHVQGGSDLQILAHVFRWVEEGQVIRVTFTR